MDDSDLIDDGPDYRSPEDIEMWELPEALGKLALFGEDTYLRMQANNLGLIDRWLMDIEAQVLQRLIHEERTPMDDAMFLNAQSQMWIFAAYELLRTWKQRAKDVCKLVANGGLQLKIDSLEKAKGYFNLGSHLRAAQLKQVKRDPQLIEKLKDDLKRIHVPFGRLEALRVSMAKHEVRGRPKIAAIAPGYGRIDQWTGSLKYEIGGGKVILDYVSRRDISDSIREINFDAPPPSDELLAGFDAHMKLLGDESEL